MTRWVVVGGGTAGCVVAAQLAAGYPADEVVIVEAGVELGGASLVNGGVVVGDPDGYRRRVPLEPPEQIGPLGQALLAADPVAAPVLLARSGGRRVDVAEAYLDPLPSNVTVRTRTEVGRLVFDGRRVRGLVTSAGDLVADRVVVCAGAVATPALLLRSAVDTPGVGEGLQEHVGAALVAAGLPAATGPDVAVTAEHGDHQFLAIESNTAMGGYGALVTGWLHVHSTGLVSLPDPDGPPTVDAGRLSDPRDQAGFAAAVTGLVRLAGHAAFRAVAGEWLVDDHGTTLADLVVTGDAGVAAWAATAPSPYHHAAGSCRLGVVTDDYGWLRGYDGVAIADASALPGVPRRNPYLAVIDLAERLSSGWLPAQ